MDQNPSQRQTRSSEKRPGAGDHRAERHDTVATDRRPAGHFAHYIGQAPDRFRARKSDECDRGRGGYDPPRGRCERNPIMSGARTCRLSSNGRFHPVTTSRMEPPIELRQILEHEGSETTEYSEIEMASPTELSVLARMRIVGRGSERYQG